MIIMKGTVYENLIGKKMISILLVWLLIASGIFVLFPIFEPRAGAILYHNNNAAWEDGDFGGGLDYNGDPAGDNKVTWHPGDNLHIITTDFVVPDGYIFEIEAGAIVLSDPGVGIYVGQTTGASFFANGTMASPVLMGPNSTGIWGGVYLFPGSYGAIDYTWIDQPELLYLDTASLDINASAITNTDSFGIYSSDSTVSATFTVIQGTPSPGIYGLNSDITVSFCSIADAQDAAIRCDNSDTLIQGSDIYGYNNSAGLDGGHAIYITGVSSYVTISGNNRIIGGAGGNDAGGGAGDGGMGIFHINYVGQLRILGNQLIQGGKGGTNLSPGGSAGNGGLGINVNPLSDSAPSPAVNISGNSLIMGGRGGDNDAPFDGWAGNGSSAIRITDNPIASSGMAIIGGNTEIIGGGGGHNHADSASGWDAGDGGDSISIIGVKKPASVDITMNLDIIGGAGGDNTGLGNNAILTGDGGAGILLWDSTDVNVLSSKITGGLGGNNTITGLMAKAGDGGNGVVPYYPNPGSSSAVFISDCTIYGGEGGDDYVGMDGGNLDGAGGGGNGIYSYFSSGNSLSSDINGGKGGDNFGPNGTGGSGGYGTYLANSMAWSVSGGAIKGGKGGSNYHSLGGGGNGGYGVLVSGTTGASFSMVQDISGGDGGDASIGDAGPGDAAMTSIFLSSSNSLSFLRNDIVVGTGGLNSSSGEYGTNGSYCFYTQSLGGDNIFLGNDITTDQRSGGTYGIRLDLTAAGSATIEGNDIYTNQVGVFVSSSHNVLVGSGNNIFDNIYGVYLSNSDVDMGPNNVISNNDYGVFCDGSSPTITEDTIIDSSIIGIYLDSASNPIVESCDISNSNNYNVYSTGASSPLFYNCSLSPSPGGGEFFQTGDSHPWLLNTTFDKSKVGFSGASSNLTVNWYVHIKVIDTTFTPVPGAMVWVNDTYGTNLFILTTDPGGWARWNIVTEYVQNTTGFEYYFTPHNASAWEGGRFGFALSEISISRDVIIMLDGISIDLPVKAGWNQISLAMNQSSTSLMDALSFVEGKYKAVRWYDINDPLDLWKHYHINKPSLLNDLTDIHTTMGLWIHMNHDMILSVTGSIPVPGTTDIQLKTGWNLVGYPSITERVAGNGSGEAFESISGFVDKVQYYDAFDSADHWKEWDPGSLSPDDLTDIKTGMGLWVHVTGDCTWTVDW